MDPFRREVTLTDEERRRFEELASELGSSSRARGADIRPGRLVRLRIALLRRRWLMVLLVPIGLLAMALAVATWWPLGVFGVGLLGLGIHAVNGVLSDRLRRLRLMDRLSGGEVS